METLNFINKIKFLFILMTFYCHGYSSSIDTIKKINCSKGFLIQINGKPQCIDSTLVYYPGFIEQWDMDQYYNMMRSINLQLLEEPKWYGEKIKENRMRIFRIKYPPSFDSIVFYSFCRQDDNFIKLKKKEMPVYYPLSYVRDSSHFVYENYGDTVKCFLDYAFSYKNIENLNSVNYIQTEFVVHKRKMQKLIKQLSAIKKCEIFDRFGPYSTFVIEYVYKEKYYLLIAREPDEWGPICDVDKQIEKNCPKKSGVKILKWLNNY